MLRLEQPTRYWRTLSQLPVSQVAHRAKLRGQRAGYRRSPIDLERRWAAAGVRDGVGPSAAGWPIAHVPVDGAVEHQPPAADGTVTLVGETHNPLRDGWRPADRTQLFRYHLHYFDWAWALARSSDRARFEEFWRSWRADTEAGRWDEWSPYVVSLRAWTLCAVFDALVAGTPIEADVVRHLRACAGFLERNLERDVGGNHLLANLKALYGLGIFLDRPDLALFAGQEVQAQVDLQVLADGGHFELSPSYHAKVLADLVDIDRLAVASGRDPLVSRPIADMQRWLRQVRFPDGSLPTLGDCTPPVGGLLDAIAGSRAGTNDEEEDELDTVSLLEATGLVVLRPRPGAMVVLDLGHPGPPELPAHIQADWGTFELWLDGRRVVVDPGVSTYVGPRRAWERSTMAHNTVSCDGVPQTEVWGSFRAGRRAKAGPIEVSASGDTIRVSATLSGLPGGKTHRRTVSADSTRLRVADQVGSTRVAYSRLTISGQRDEQRVTAAHPTLVNPVRVGVGFGETTDAIQLTQHLAGGAGWYEIALEPDGADG